MIESKDIKKFTHHVFQRSNGVPDKHMIHPQREWVLIVVSFLIIFISGGVYSWYQYQYYQGYADTVTAQADSSIPTYRQAVVAAAHEKYGLRREQFQAYINAPIPVVDDVVATSTLDSDDPIEVMIDSDGEVSTEEVEEIEMIMSGEES